MRKNNDFLGRLCHLYLIGMMVFLPLYTGGTYSKLGDTKYIVFRNLTVLCLGIWFAVLALEALGILWGKCKLRILQFHYQSKRANALWLQERQQAGQRLSLTDLFILLYGGAVILSAICSQYRGTPWTGFQEWYMGAVSQLLFVGIYFFVSRCYDGKKYPVFFGIGGFFAVTAFGILHRLGFDPLGLLKDYYILNWTYSHMLSTVGNINWFCGYAGVALALPVSAFLRSKGGWEKIALYIVSVAGLFLLFVQGSDTGVIATAVCLLVCLVWGHKEKAVFRETFLLLSGVSFLLPCYCRLAAFLGERALAALPVDGIGWSVIGSNVWWAVGAGALGLWFLLWRAEKQEGSERCAPECKGRDQRVKRRGQSEEEARGASNKGTISRRNRRIHAAAVAILFSALAGGAAYLLANQPAGEMWGNGRGLLWKTAVEGFRRNGLTRKMIGVGPDCFAEYIYSIFSKEALPTLEGRWVGAVYANAHNEWLNHLVNLGIIGTGLYLGIFVFGVVRYRRYLSGVLALIMYGTVSMTCFQQCMSTPLLFLTLGLCESGLRRSIHGEAGWKVGSGEPEDGESEQRAREPEAEKAEGGESEQRAREPEAEKAEDRRDTGCERRGSWIAEETI